MSQHDDGSPRPTRHLVLDLCALQSAIGDATVHRDGWTLVAESGSNVHLDRYQCGLQGTSTGGDKRGRRSHPTSSGAASQMPSNVTTFVSPGNVTVPESAAACQMFELGHVGRRGPPATAPLGREMLRPRQSQSSTNRGDYRGKSEMVGSGGESSPASAIWRTDRPHGQQLRGTGRAVSRYERSG